MLALVLTASTLSASNEHLATATTLELQALRAATARFHNVQTAIDAGYMDIDYAVPHMGRHFVNFGLIDGTFDPSRPQILVYAPNEGNGTLRLVAAEFAVPLDHSPEPPEGFTGSDDVWFHDSGFGIWSLHAWVWNYNPDGTFMPFNPRVP